MAAVAELAPARAARRYGSSPRVLFVNDLWGYGTVTMAMAIADEVGGEVTRLFAGQGPGFDLARRSSFDGLLRVDTRADPVLRELDRLIERCQVVVSVMNGPVARRATEKGIPCLYVDCLAWMWADPPPVPSGVPYFAEAFPGARAAVERWRDRLYEPEVVGPMVVRPSAGRSSFRDAVLVNFGGLASWLLGPETPVAYADAMARCVLSAVGRGPERVVVAVGRHVLERMNEAGLRAMHPGVELVDLSHEAYLAELRRSRVLFSSAGMHAFYEACATGVPCLCLPSQNLSGALALKELAQGEIARALDWGDLYGLDDLDPADEPGACRRIEEQIVRFSRDVFTQDRLTRHLAAALDGRRLAGIQRKQAAFHEAQGPLGAPHVAERVRNLLRAPACAPVKVAAATT